MSRTLRVEGYSDDTFGVYEGNGGDDHDDCATGRLMAFRLTAGDAGLIVMGRYARHPGADGTWMVGVSLLEEDKPLPDWPTHWETADNGYSPSLVIEAPDDVQVEDITEARPPQEARDGE